MFGRQKIATLVAEFLGTGVLTLLILSVQRSTIGVPFFVAMAAGLTLALMTFAFGRVSGANLNPAITIGMWTARRISTLTAVLFIIVQFLGAWAAYGLYTYFVNSSLQKVGGDFSGRILVAEAVGAGIFAFGWAAAYYQRYSPAVTAAFAGVSYMVGIVAASSAAIGLLNPAVAFGVRAWVLGTYVLGPIIGAVIGINLYNLFFARSEALVAGEAATAATAPAAATVAKKPRRTAAAKKPAAAKRGTTTRRTR
jgi:glycerol uptake facilitator-like aquaporin